MPFYTFSCDQCEETWDEVRPLSEAGEPSLCPGCGEEGYRDYSAESGNGCFKAEWSRPLLSDSAGVHPSQIDAEKRKHPDHKFTPDGRMIFENRKHMKKCLRDIGMADYDDYR